MGMDFLSRLGLVSSTPDAPKPEPAAKPERPSPTATSAATVRAAATNVAAMASSITNQTTIPTVPLTTGVVADNDEMYQKLVAKSDFEQTPTAASLHKFLDPIQSMPIDATLKFKMAAAQAKAQNGLTEDDILSTFDTLKGALQREADKFAQFSTDFTNREVTAREQRIQEINDAIQAKQAEIQQLQQEAVAISTDLGNAKNKAVSTQSQFTSALQRRINELDQQKAQYATLLKG